MAANYCRREIAGKPCGRAIARANALDWCPECRSRLPLWPVVTPEDLRDIQAQDETGRWTNTERVEEAI
jgi:hypothetical protein